VKYDEDVCWFGHGVGSCTCVGGYYAVDVYADIDTQVVIYTGAADMRADSGVGVGVNMGAGVDTHMLCW